MLTRKKKHTLNMRKRNVKNKRRDKEIPCKH